jgi:hypothetical protein
MAEHMGQLLTHRDATHPVQMAAFKRIHQGLNAGVGEHQPVQQGVRIQHHPQGGISVFVGQELSALPFALDCEYNRKLFGKLLRSSSRLYRATRDVRCAPSAPGQTPPHR